MKTTPFLSHQNLILLCILIYSISTIQNTSCSPNSRPHRVNPASLYINKSCKTTLHPKLCSKTLIKHAERIKSDPKALAMTALIATFNATQTTSTVLRRLRRSGAMKAGEGAAVTECVELVSDAVYELHKSVKELNQSRKGNRQFFLQMNDVQTWVSAALTDDDTCMDDFPAAGGGGGRKIKVLVRGFVLTVARLTTQSCSMGLDRLWCYYCRDVEIALTFGTGRHTVSTTGAFSRLAGRSFDFGRFRFCLFYVVSIILL